MPNVTVTCDRCKQQIDGIREPADPATGFVGATGGFYETGNPEGWGKYADPGERIVCDACMHADPRYIAVYGDRRAKTAGA